MPVSDQTPNVIIIDSSENPMEVSGGQPVPNGTKGLLAVGIQSNGTASYLSLDSAGFLRITGSVSQTGAYTVTGSVTVSNTVAITGSVGISGVPTVTGSVTVANQLNVTGSIAVTNVPAVTGSVSVLNTVTITARTLAGSGTLAPFTGSLVGGKDASGNFQPLAVTTGGFLFVSGNVSASIVGTPTVTGSVTVPNTVTVTGSVGVTNFPATQSVTGTVGISGTPTVTGSVSVLNAVTVTGSVATTIVNPTLAGTGSLSPTTGSLVGGKDASGNFQPFAVTTGGVQFISGAVSASIVGVPTVTGSITVPNTVAVTGSVGISGTPTITGSISVLNTVNVAFADPAEGITGSIPPSRAIFIGGYDAGSVAMRALSVDATGKLNVNATAAGSPNVGGTGSAAPTSASLGGAVDGSGILRSLLSDNSGRQIVQIFNTASITGSVGLSQTATVTGSITVPNTVVITGSVGIVDSTFDATNGGAVPARIAIVGGISGSTAVGIRTNNSGSVVTESQEEKTFVIRSTSTALGNNKSMLSLLNASISSFIQLKEVYIINVQTSAVTGIIAIFELFRFTGHSAGTLLTPQPYDTADVMDANVTARTGATITGESATSMARWLWSSDEWGPGTLDEEGHEHTFQNLLPAWAHRSPNSKAILLRPGQGIHLKHVVNSTAGTFDIVFVFTQR